MSGGRDLYKQAGVDIDAMTEALKDAGGVIRSTFTEGVLGDIGLFGGLFDLEKAGVGRGCLVASTDGVGTKIRIAGAMRRFDTVGQCLVNHCVNDILVQGARPLFFLDYLGTGRLDREQFAGLLAGLAKACRENRTALLGGETAEMPGVYGKGDFDLVGTIVGIVEPERLLDGSRVEEGDLLLALPSTGLHTNGYTLARKLLLEDRGFLLEDQPKELGGRKLGEVLLEVHRSYLDPVGRILDGPSGSAVHSCAHITGGGLLDNLPRVLPEGLGAEVEIRSVPRPPIFELCVGIGSLHPEEAYRVFNMGFGFVLVVAEDAADRILRELSRAGQPAYRAGRVVRGAGVSLLDGGKRI